MSETALSEALKPLAGRLPRVVREYEILRVKGSLLGADPARMAELARREILRWAQNRCGGRLPNEAWALSPFDYFAGGRNSSCVTIQNERADIWALRADDPDKHVAERIWTTEVVVGFSPGERAQFSLRSLVNTPEGKLEIEPHTPGLVQQVATNCRLASGTYGLLVDAWVISTAADAQILVEMLIDPGRNLPVFVLSIEPYGACPKISEVVLAKAVLGMAHVAVIPAEFTWILTDNLGRQRSVFGGAVRAYLPGFAEDANPYAHRLFLADQLSMRDGASTCMSWLRNLAATESVRRHRLGQDVLTFAAIRTACLQMGRERLETQGASDSVLLNAARDQLKALEQQVDDQKSSLNYFASEHASAEERAQVSEMQVRASAFRIQQLLDQLKSRGEKPDSNLEKPKNWAELTDWSDCNLAGRVTLTPSARRGVRSPSFLDVEQVTTSLLWLANDCRNRRLKGGGSIREEAISEGLRNAHCGSDVYDMDWHGRRCKVDWHIKNGGNTRDPVRCLRIYYFWDDETQQIVVADMPAHRRTEAT